MKPLLAATWEPQTELRFPLLASPKLDGFRCLIVNGNAMTRNLKPIKNEYVAACLRGLPDLDGELIVGSATRGAVFNRTSSGVTSRYGQPSFLFNVFDRHDMLQDPFYKRLEAAKVQHPNVWHLEHTTLASMLDLDKYETDCLKQGYEGVMLRDPLGMYKHGRSTPNEGILWKVKRFKDSEFRITGFDEGQSNMNVATRDALGETTRSTHKAGMKPNGQIGTLHGIDIHTGAPVTVSPGRMTVAERLKYFQNPWELINKIGKYKFFEYGAVDAPRFSTFQGFRHEDDL